MNIRQSIQILFILGSYYIVLHTSNMPYQMITMLFWLLLALVFVYPAQKKLSLYRIIHEIKSAASQVVLLLFATSLLTLFYIDLPFIQSELFMAKPIRIFFMTFLFYMYFNLDYRKVLQLGILYVSLSGFYLIARYTTEAEVFGLAGFYTYIWGLAMLFINIFMRTNEK